MNSRSFFESVLEDIDVGVEVIEESARKRERRNRKGDFFEREVRLSAVFRLKEKIGFRRDEERHASHGDAEKQLVYAPEPVGRMSENVRNEEGEDSDGVVGEVRRRGTEGKIDLLPFEPVDRPKNQGNGESSNPHARYRIVDSEIPGEAHSCSDGYGTNRADGMRGRSFH